MEFYKKDYGAVLGFAIDKYVYVSINRRFESTIRASYSKTESVNNSSELKHELIRESLLYYGINNGVEVVTVADVPGTGTGLGSSSSTLVGLITAISHFTEKLVNKEDVAKLACFLEIEKIKSPIGKQDQYFATFGGLSYFRFHADESVLVEKLEPSKTVMHELQENILCFYTGIPRISSAILSEQKDRVENNEQILYDIRKLADDARDSLKNGDLTKFGEMLNIGWQLKRKLASAISNDVINAYYDRALKAGALGGKINGAGGGGFLTLYCEAAHRQKVRESLSNLKELNVKIDHMGSTLIFSG